MSLYTRLRRRLTRKRMVVFAVAVVTLVFIYPWSPVLAGLLLAGAVVGLALTFAPSAFDIEVHGPGHQFRDDSNKRN
jgi:MFS superfamily sulfate permease-like transporter